MRLRALTRIVALMIVGAIAGPARTQVVTWEPAQPWQGGPVTIYYDVVEGTLPDDAPNVYIHLGYNGWTDVNDFPMTFTGNGGWWRFDWTVPEGVTVIDLVFFYDVNGNGVGDSGDQWDNNGGVGVDWHIPVIPPDLWFPLVPNPNDTVKVSVEHEGGGGLWWGVNGWQEPIRDYWPPGTVRGEAGASVESPLLGPDTTGRYWILVGPFKEGRQPVEVLDFVFHWSDGTWDNNNGEDYHIPFDFTPRSGDPTIAVLSHSDGDFVDSVEVIRFETFGSVYTEVWIDGATHYVGTGDDHSFEWNTGSVELGKHVLWFRAEGKDERVTFTKLTLWKIPEVVHEPVPAGTALGVTDHGDGTVTFALLAPGKAFVSLLGGWEGWDPGALVMNYDAAEGIWWREVSLSPGTYNYMYLLEGQKKLGDPYATDVEWKLDGQEDWRVENQISRFTVGEEPFEWSDGDWQPPVMEDLIIYELLIRDFTPGGDMEGVIEKLDYLAELGINAIELMPNYEFPGSSSWGYNPSFLFAVESSYGTPDDFKRLVNEAHARGIAVIMDLVFNHCDATSPYYQLYETDYDRSPYIHAEQNPWGMPDFDHTKEGTKRLVKDVVRYWMEEYHVDGFRYDNTTGFGWSGLNDYGISVFSYEAWQVNPRVYQIAEHFSSLSDLTALMSVTKINSHWHDIFHDQMKANLREGPFEGATYGDLVSTARGIDFEQHGFSRPRNIVNYTESHDEQRVIWEARTNGTIDDELAVQKSMLGLTVLLTSTGVPMLFHGQEFGMATERTLDRNPLDWSKLESPVGRKIYDHTRRLLWLRTHYPALRGSDCNFFFSSPNKVIVYDRSDGAETVVVAANFSRDEKTVDVPFPHSGTWYEYVNDDTFQVSGDTATLTIPGSKGMIFVDTKRWMEIRADHPDIPGEFSLGQNAPNPFNPLTRIDFSLDRRGETTLVIHDLLGREVNRLVSGVKGPGRYSITWDGTDRHGRPVASGVYLYTLMASGHTATRKLLLLR